MFRNRLLLMVAAVVLAIRVSPALAGACDDAANIHQSAAINIGTNATTAFIASASGARVYVCSIVASLSGGTVVLKYGTRVTADCDTGAVNLSGTIALATGSMYAVAYGGDLFVTPPSGQ